MYLSKLVKSTTTVSSRSMVVSQKRFIAAPLLPKLAPNKRVLVEETKDGKFTNKVTANSHILMADEPGTIEGGKDSGMSPYDLLLSSLGTCTSMTLRMYADRKQIPLENIRVNLTHQKVWAKDVEDKALQGKEGKIDKIDLNVELVGRYLTEEQRKRMLDIAEKCPVHQTLKGTSYITTKLV